MTTKTPSRMEGIVRSCVAYYYLIECPDAPKHLRWLSLTGAQMKGAGPGDRVVLEYQTTISSGLWNVVEVL